jgi:hypothetical protein
MARFLFMVQIGNKKYRMIFIPSLVKSSYGWLTLLLHQKIDPKKHCSIKDIYKMKRNHGEDHFFIKGMDARLDRHLTPKIYIYIGNK